MSKYNITFEKDINDSYMYIDGVKVNKDSYESTLLKNTAIDRILKYYLVDNGEISKLRYDITGLASLDSYVKKHSLKQEDITFIIREISNMLMSAENYLISENSIILNPETIMITLSKNKNNNIKKKLLFTVIPSFNGDFYEQLVKLLLYILRNVDKSDKKSILLAYNLFSESAKENFTINNLLSIILANEQLESKQNINTDINEEKIDESNNLYHDMDPATKEPLVVNDHAIAYVDNDSLINYNDETYIDSYTKNILDTKYISDHMEKEEHRKNIEYLKSLELDDINEGYDIQTLKAYRDRIVKNSENSYVKKPIFQNLLSIKNTLFILFGIFVPVFIKTWFGMDVLMSNIKYVVGIEIVLSVLIALDIIDNIRENALTN